LEVTTNGPQCRESVYGITTKVVTTIGVESVPQRKNIFAKSNSSSWLFKKFWEFSNSEMITQKSRKLLLRNSKIRVKKQFGGYPGTTYWFLGIKIYLQEGGIFKYLWVLVVQSRKSKFEI
jgi:hypothetical protein